MNVALIQYNGGNVVSVRNALRRLGVEATVTDDAETIRQADRVIFPGVGEASSAMRSLQALGLDAVIQDLRQPFLGICLGLQLLCRRSEEGDAYGLGVFDIDVQRFPADGISPHMGWNTIEFDRSPLFEGISDGVSLYFVHSFYAAIGDCTLARGSHTTDFSAALGRDNFWAVQFHPEKSADAGARILKNFLERT